MELRYKDKVLPGFVQSPPGEAGADGKSAYEIAVENGYSGTETEWLASLKGGTGEQGPQGETGAKGDKGDTGAVYTPEVAEDGTLSWTNNGGLDNPTPVNIMGPAGPKGETGEQGPKGDNANIAAGDGIVVRNNLATGMSTISLESGRIDVIPYGVTVQSIDDLEEYIPRIKNNLEVDIDTNTTVTMNIYAYSSGFYLATSDGMKTFLTGVMSFDVYENSVRILMQDQTVWRALYTKGNTGSPFSSMDIVQKPYPKEFPSVDGSTIVIDTDFRELKVPIDKSTIVMKNGKMCVNETYINNILGTIGTALDGINGEVV